MALKLGNNAISKVYLGATEVSKLYLGSNIVHEIVASNPNILVNSSFTGSSAPWSGFGDQWSWSEGFANATACVQLLSQTIGSAIGQIEAGETYEIKADIVLSVGRIRFRLGGTTMTNGTGFGGTQTITHQMVAGADGIFRMDDDIGDFTGTVTNVELRKV